MLSFSSANIANNLTISAQLCKKEEDKLNYKIENRADISHTVHLTVRITKGTNTVQLLELTHCIKTRAVKKPPQLS